MFRQARLAVTVLTDLLLTTKTSQQLMNEDAEASPNDDRNADPQGNLRSHGNCATGHEASEKSARLGGFSRCSLWFRTVVLLVELQ